MAGDRLARQVAFLTEADKLKSILRRTPLTDGSRPENSAEHELPALWPFVLDVLDQFFSESPTQPSN